MRLIDADALMKEIKFDIADAGLTESLTFYRIMNAPTIDAVSVVRCKECKRNGTKDCAMWYDNAEYEIQYSWNTLNDYCSWAERKDK